MRYQFDRLVDYFPLYRAAIGLEPLIYPTIFRKRTMAINGKTIRSALAACAFKPTESAATKFLCDVGNQEYYLTSARIKMEQAMTSTADPQSPLMQSRISEIIRLLILAQLSDGKKKT